MRPILLLLLSSRSNIMRNIIFVSIRWVFVAKRVQGTGFILATLYYGSYLKSDMR